MRCNYCGSPFHSKCDKFKARLDKEKKMVYERDSFNHVHKWVPLFYFQSNGTQVTMKDHVVCEQCRVLAEKVPVQQFEYKVISK